VAELLVVVRVRAVVPAELAARPVVVRELVVRELVVLAQRVVVQARVPVVAEPLVVAVEQPEVVQAAVRLVQAEVAVPAVSVAPMRPHCRPHRVSPVATRAPRHLWVRLMPAPVSSAMAAVQERVAAQAAAQVPAAVVVLMWDNSSTRPAQVQAPRSTLRRAWEPLSARRFRRPRPLVVALRWVAALPWVVVPRSVAVRQLAAEHLLVVVRRLVVVPRLAAAPRLAVARPSVAVRR
jgi:hypothetical protein